MYKNARDGRSGAKNWQARSFDQIAVYIYIILSTDSQKLEAGAGRRRPGERKTFGFGDGLVTGKLSFFIVLGGVAGGKRNGGGKLKKNN